MNSKLEKSFRNLSISRSSLSEKEDVISKNSDANQSFEKPLFDRPVLPPEVFEEEQKQSFSNKASADNLASQQDTETFEIVSFKAGKTLRNYPLCHHLQVTKSSLQTPSHKKKRRKTSNALLKINLQLNVEEMIPPLMN